MAIKANLFNKSCFYQFYKDFALSWIQFTLHTYFDSKKHFNCVRHTISHSHKATFYHYPFWSFIFGIPPSHVYTLPWWHFVLSFFVFKFQAVIFNICIKSEFMIVEKCCEVTKSESWTTDNAEYITDDSIP